MTGSSDLSCVSTQEFQEALGRILGVIVSKFQELDKKFELTGRLFEDVRNAWKETDEDTVFAVGNILDIVAALQMAGQSNGWLHTMKLQA